MSRLKFILIVAMLVAVGTLVFSITQGKSDAKRRGADNKSPNQTQKSNLESKSVPQSKRTARISNSDRYELRLADGSTSRLGEQDLALANAIISETEKQARQKLDSLSAHYFLTNSQRQQIFPLIIAHSDQAHPSMLVDGQPLPAISPGMSLNESLYGLLDADQQDKLAESAIADDAWWKDVVGQLENDLDQAIDNGEMVAAPYDSGAEPGITSSAKSAVGDGEASTHTGGNLFDLLGR
ncbi:MAG: hypothetical protein QNL33_16890 [Akkermansiaceae bacterium]|jgi:hypothetical protein